MARTVVSTAPPSVPNVVYVGLLLALVTLPPLYLYFSRRSASKKLKRTGIGRGAPGFQTNVKRIAVTPEIAERLRRGEQVSPEEIEAAQKAVQERAAAKPAAEDKNETTEEENEWIPEIHKKKSGKGGKRRK